MDPEDVPEFMSDNMAASPEINNGQDAIERFEGKKARRKSSALKIFLGDYLGMSTNPQILRLITKHGDSQILFADHVIKVNRRHKMQKRVLLITDQAMYNLDPHLKCKRRIPLQIIGRISLSTMTDNFFAINIPTEYDYLMISSKKVEIVTHLKNAYKENQNVELEVMFSDAFTYRIDASTTREIRFSRVKGGVTTQVFTQKS
ncbi:Myosin tail [Carpediemonas membranifera]|uniref:Myosin tail n=1 Tax=Carpediemonas membranifera TaxID=201153 RepID=A0A8J6B6V8_9EUKA|nr:Myosin tail [Carpediemonas membranifera]|eukprot:KAG9396903.1 Myosin tail [Carpediemonas membranifera]